MVNTDNNYSAKFNYHVVRVFINKLCLVFMLYKYISSKQFGLYVYSMAISKCMVWLLVNVWYGY